MFVEIISCVSLLISTFNYVEVLKIKKQNQQDKQQVDDFNKQCQLFSRFSMVKKRNKIHDGYLSDEDSSSDEDEDTDKVNKIC